MTPIQALQILDSVDNSEPVKKQAAINTIVRESPKWVMAVATSNKKRAEAQQKEIDTLKALVVAIVKATGVDVSAMGVTAQVADPNGFVEVPNGNGHAQAAAEPVAPASSPARTNRVYQDGTPMSPEDAAKEDQMDAAIAASAGEPSAPPGRTPFAG